MPRTSQRKPATTGPAGSDAAGRRKVRLSVAMSLDGFIAGPNGEADWIPMDPDIDFKALFARYDTILVGRKSYEAAQAMGGVGFPGMQVHVVSRTLQEKDVRGAKLANDPKALLAELRSVPGKDIWLFGGGELLRGLLADGLVDEIQVAIVPILLGGGLPLLPPPADRSKLILLEQTLYPKTGTLLLEYALAP
jgi:dihydrofolate reductase